MHVLISLMLSTNFPNVMTLAFNYLKSAGYNLGQQRSQLGIVTITVFGFSAGTKFSSSPRCREGLLCPTSFLFDE
jgi:hypothetical protein